MQRGDSSLELVGRPQPAMIDRLWKKRHATLTLNDKPVLRQIFVHISEFEKKRWLGTGELCPECFDYLYRRRALEQPKQSVFQLTAESVSVSGSLLDLLSRMPCPLCMAITHLLSPVALSTLLQLSLDEPAPDLQDTEFIMLSDPHHDNRLTVQRRRAPLRSWSHVGFVEATAMPNHPPLKLPYTTMQKDFRKACSLSGDDKDSASWFRSTLVDYGLIQSWLNKCDRDHGQCQAQRHVSDKNAQIRLIDVMDKCIVRANLWVRYLALSYMWGGVVRLRVTTENIALLERPGALDQMSVSEGIPTVIKDAITFAQNLGCRYLWVDAFCIVENDITEKHSQIAMMDKIYAAAYATIVQHSGQTADAALPGVTIGSRSVAAITAPVRHTITGEALISMANYSVPEIFRSSPHSTRGWTLQEVLLSPRCLHFFDKHVTFVCNQHYAQDWNQGRTGRLDFSRQAMLEMNPLKVNYDHRREEGVQKHKLGSSTDDTLRSKNQVEWLLFFEVYARIFTDYRSRSLTYDTDILNAFEGLGAQIVRLNNGTMHYGLPSVSFDLALLWICPQLSKRQHGNFPTWSPAAWIGLATYNLCNVTGIPAQPLRHYSYVRNYWVLEKGKSIAVIRREAFQSAPSEFGRLRQALDDPHVEIQDSWPDGCLHFWAEGATFDQWEAFFKEDEEYPYLRVAKPPLAASYDESELGFHYSNDWFTTPTVAGAHEESKAAGHADSDPRGIIFLTAGSYRNIVQDVIAECLLILLSECRKTAGGARLGSRSESGLVFNVILVQRSGDYVQRLAFGQILPSDWARLKRRREYFKII